MDSQGATIDGISDTTLDRIGDLIGQGLENGDPTSVTAAAIGAYIDDPDRAFTIALTESSRAMIAGQADQYQQQGFSQFEWLAYDGACDECMDQEDANPHDFADEQPPGHPNCFPAGTVVHSPGIDASTQRWFDGELVEIVTASGKLLAGTPNHPVLTPEGFVALGLLVEGSHVISSASPERVAHTIDPDDHHGPAMIEQVAESLGGSSSVSSRTMPTAPKDFHGDGLGSEVHVVRTNGKLRHRDDPSLGKHLGHDDLTGTNAEPSLLTSGSSTAPFIEGLDSVARSDVGGLDIAPIFLDASPGHHEPVGFEGAPWLDAMFQEHTTNGRPGDAGLIRQRLLAIAPDVAPDKIVSVRRYPFAGHVYNLQTATSYYIANSIVVHNCRCSIVGAGEVTTPEGALDAPDTLSPEERQTASDNADLIEEAVARYASRASAERDLSAIRSEVGAELHDARDEAHNLLGLVDHAIAKPPPAKPYMDPVTGIYRYSRGKGGEWDWWDRLHPEEQARLVRKGYVRDGGVTVDEWQNLAVELGFSRPEQSSDEVMEKWLKQTRIIDAVDTIDSKGSLPSERALANQYGHLDLDHELRLASNYRVDEVFQTKTKAIDYLMSLRADVANPAAEADKFLETNSSLLTTGKEVWEMSEDEYLGLVYDSWGKMDEVWAKQEAAKDSEFGAVLTHDELETIRLWDSLVPADLVNNPDELDATALYQQIVQLAKIAGRI